MIGLPIPSTTGRWVVLDTRDGMTLGKGERICVCVCGSVRPVRTRSIASGRSLSCGCLNKDVQALRNRVHGMVGTTEHGIWTGIKSRCHDSNRKEYPNYGGRGIKVCERWIRSFSAFYEDMGPRPSDKHSINRVNNDGDYTPDNCKWATRHEQAINKRISARNKTGVSGVCFSRQEERWKARISKNSHVYHLGTYTDFFEACCARKSAENKYWRML